MNLQKTPLDKKALCIHAMCDVVMEKLMERLGIDIPEFKLRRRVGFSKKNGKLVVRGVDFNGAPYSILTGVSFGQVEVKDEPFEVEEGVNFGEIKLRFQGHYEEPEFTLNMKCRDF